MDARIYQRLLRDPSLIEQETSADTLVVVNQIQKLPSLLDEVHRLISLRGQKFLLAGSSARKLRKGAANLLAGRAYQAALLPLISREIPDFDLMAYLNTTGLPEFYGKAAEEYLHAYVGTYLQEEIRAEALARNLVSFARFLEVIALSNGTEINYANISIKEEGLVDQFIMVSLDPTCRQTADGIRILPWPTFLEEIWSWPA